MEILKCHYCALAADFLCDKPTRRPSPGTPGATCDRPVCRYHSVRAGSYVSCQRGRKPCCRRGTIDHCPEHGGALGFLAMPWPVEPAPTGGSPAGPV